MTDQTKTPHVRFALPVGAIIAGLRHLGGGEFSRALEHDRNANFPMVLEGVMPEGQDWPRFTPMEVCADPLEGVQLQRVISLADLRENGVPITDGCSPELNASIRAACGLITIPAGHWHDPAEHQPKGDGWYERKHDTPGMRCFAMWTAFGGTWFPCIVVDAQGRHVRGVDAKRPDLETAPWRSPETTVPRL